MSLEDEDGYLDIKLINTTYYSPEVAELKHPLSASLFSVLRKTSRGALNLLTALCVKVQEVRIRSLFNTEPPVQAIEAN